MRYDQAILYSAEQTVKHYLGKIDKVYLFCNNDLRVTCDGYKSAEKILSDAGIELVPITNKRVLDLVFQYPPIYKDWRGNSYTKYSGMSAISYSGAVAGGASVGVSDSERTEQDIIVTVVQSENSVLSGTATVPKGTKIESSAITDHDATLTLTITDDEADDGIQPNQDGGDQIEAYDVTITGVSPDNETLIVVCLNMTYLLSEESI